MFTECACGDVLTLRYPLLAKSLRWPSLDLNAEMSFALGRMHHLAKVWPVEVSIEQCVFILESWVSSSGHAFQKQVFICHDTIDDHDLFGPNYKATVMDITHNNLQLHLLIVATFLFQHPNCITAELWVFIASCQALLV